MLFFLIHTHFILLPSPQPNCSQQTLNTQSLTSSPKSTSTPKLKSKSYPVTPLLLSYGLYQPNGPVFFPSASAVISLGSSGFTGAGASSTGAGASSTGAGASSSGSSIISSGMSPRLCRSFIARFRASTAACSHCLCTLFGSSSAAWAGSCVAGSAEGIAFSVVESAVSKIRVISFDYLILRLLSL